MIRARFVAFCLMVVSGGSAAIANGAPPVTVRKYAHFVPWFIKNESFTNWDGPVNGTVSTIPWRHDALPGIGYDSYNKPVIREQMAELWANGITPLISWFGRDRDPAGDAFLHQWMRMQKPEYLVRPGIIYEVTELQKVNSEGKYDFDDPENVQRFVDNVKYLQDTFWGPYGDRFARTPDGRPVMFIWLSHAFAGNFEAAARQAHQFSDVYIIGSNFSVSINTPVVFSDSLVKIVRGLDAVSAYGVYSPAAEQRYGTHYSGGFVQDYVVSVMAWSAWLKTNAPNVKMLLPLQFALDDRFVIPARGNRPMNETTPEEARVFAETARSILAISSLGCGNVEPAILFVSYNEHWEGTSLEPNDVHGSAYLDVLREVFEEPIPVGSCNR